MDVISPVPIRALPDRMMLKTFAGTADLKRALILGGTSISVMAAAPSFVEAAANRQADALR